MATMQAINIIAVDQPTTPPSVALTALLSKAEQHEHQQSDLPSPPTSISKALSQHSNDDVDDKNDLTAAAASSIDTPSRSTVEEHERELRPEVYRPAPPSPPPSTHSSEDSHTPIRPSYFYPQPSDAEATGVSSTILADVAPGIPVFEPTWEEFKDFYTFCQRIDEWGMKTGIVKIIPPKEWIDSLPRLDGRSGTTSTTSKQDSSGPRYTENNPLSQIRIKNSIEQIFTPAGSGSWRQSNVVHPARVLNAKQWADICATASQKGPEMNRMKENAKREEVEGLEEDGVRTRSGRGHRVVSTPVSTSASRSAAKRKRSVEASKPIEETKVDSIEDTSVDASVQYDMPDLEDADVVSKGKLKMADRTTQQEWDAFDYVAGWCQEAGQDCKSADWTPSACKAIESEYWRGLNFGKAPMYGADLKGTLFTPATQHWNVGSLDNILTRLRLRRKLPGVTTPYLYFGMWRATFAWHVEDMDLYSINYIHFGAPKQWYAIRQSDRQRFELAMAGAFPGDSARCKHFMRHKSYLASPAFLAATAGIKPLRLVQKAQEFVITYPYGYHSGFNLGYNCAESVNFALESWLDIGRKAGYCDCANDSVKMDVDAMLEESREMQELDKKRQEREKRKEADEKLQQTEQEKLDIRRAKERERRRARKVEHARLEALGLLPSGDREGTFDDESPAPPAKKIKTQSLPCVFCPSTSHEDLVVIPSSEDEADPGRKPIRRAHRLCACFLPETWVAPNPKWHDGSKEPTELVMGFSGIEKARWSLKCQNCLDPNMAKRGAKVQCTFGKCSRTTHVSCALYTSSGWMLDMLGGEEADILEGKSKKIPKDAVESSQCDSVMQEIVLTKQEQEADFVETEEEEPTRIVILCRSHNPHERERELRRRAEILRRCVETLTVGQMIKVRMGSGVWETILQEIRWVENRASEGEVVVDEAQTVVKWSKVMFDEEIVKKAGEEQRQLEEEGALAMQAQAEVESVIRPRSINEEARMQLKKEKDQAKEQLKIEKIEREQVKAAEKEKKEAVKLVKEEEKRINDGIKLEKKAEREAKNTEKEAAAKIRAQKKAEREARKAEKLAISGIIMTAPGMDKINHTGFADAGSKLATSSPIQTDYNYIRQWMPSIPSQNLNAPRPILPNTTSTTIERTLHPVYQSQQQQQYYRPPMATYTPTPTASLHNGYPAHLATYQSRPLQHPMYQHQHQQQYHQQFLQHRHPFSANTSLHYAPRPMNAQVSYAYHHQQQQQQGYYASNYPTATRQEIANGAAAAVHPSYSYPAHKVSPVPMHRTQTEESAERGGHQ